MALACELSSMVRKAIKSGVWTGSVSRPKEKSVTVSKAGRAHWLKCFDNILELCNLIFDFIRGYN